MGESVTFEAGRIRSLSVRMIGPFGLIFNPVPGNRPSEAEADEILAPIRTALFTDQVYKFVAAHDSLVAFFDHVRAPEEAIRIAKELASGLEERGYSGTISPAAGKLPRGWGTSVPTLTAVLYASEAALDDTRQLLHLMPKKVLPLRWAVDSEAFRNLVKGVLDWALENYKSSLRVGSYFSYAECRPDQAADIVARCCTDVGDAQVILETALSEVQIAFSRDGYVHVDVVLDPGKLEPAMRALANLIARLSAGLDYAFLTRARSGLHSPAALLGGAPRYLPTGIDRPTVEDHEALKHSILDVFDVQLLGPQHEDLLPPEEWTTWPLANGRRAMVLKNAAWFATNDAAMERLKALRAANAGHFLIEFDGTQLPPSWPAPTS